MEQHPFTEEELLRLLEEDLEEGARALWDTYSGLVCWVCGRRLPDPEDVKECVNDTFAEFCRDWRRFDPEKGSLKNYLCLLADRRALDRYRKNQNRERAEAKAREQEAPAAEPLEYQDLEEALAQLDPVDQEILRKKYYGGLSFREIAGQLGLPHETVKKRNQRALKKLLQILAIGLLLGLLAGCAALVYRYFQFREGSGVHWDLELPQYQLAEAPPSCEADGIRFTLADMEYQDGQLRATIVYQSLREVESEAGWLRFQELPSFYFREAYADGVRLSLPEGGYYSSSTELARDKKQTDLFFRWQPQEETEEISFRFSLCPSQEDGEPAVWTISSGGTGREDYRMQGPTPAFDVTLRKTEVYTDPRELGQVLEHGTGSLLLREPETAAGDVWLSLYPLEGPEGVNLSYLLTYHALGLGDFPREAAYLTDSRGNRREADRVEGQDFQGESRLYFPDLEAGAYTLHLPYLCWEGDGSETEISVPVPEPGEWLPLDETVELATGASVRFTGIRCQLAQEEVWDFDYSVSPDPVRRVNQYRDYYLEVELLDGSGPLRLCAVQLLENSSYPRSSLATSEGLRIRTWAEEEGTSLLLRVGTDVYVQEEEVTAAVTVEP